MRHKLNAIHRLPPSNSPRSHCLIKVQGFANLSIFPMMNTSWHYLRFLINYDAIKAQFQEHGSIHFIKQICYTHQMVGILRGYLVVFNM